MDIRSPLVADLQTSIPIQPGQSSLNEPTVSPQALAGIDAPPSNAREDATLAQSLPKAGEVVCFVGMQLAKSSARMPSSALDRSVPRLKRPTAGRPDGARR